MHADLGCGVDREEDGASSVLPHRHPAKVRQRGRNGAADGITSFWVVRRYALSVLREAQHSRELHLRLK